jgi:hypothetical protein
MLEPATARPPVGCRVVSEAPLHEHIVEFLIGHIARRESGSFVPCTANDILGLVGRKRVENFVRRFRVDIPILVEVDVQQPVEGVIGDAPSF